MQNKIRYALRTIRKPYRRHSLPRFIFGRMRRNWLIIPIAAISRYIVERNHNEDRMMTRNGETWLMGEVVKYFGYELTVLDVGANVGEWTEAMLKFAPDADVHAFELVPHHFKNLEAKLSGIDNVHLVPHGLSDVAGEVDIYLNHFSSMSGLYQRVDMAKSEVVKCTVITGDDYLAEKRIETVNYLKIDVEGAEHLVLRGFAKALEDKKIDVISFEYGEFNIASRSLLRDFYSYLDGYHMGRLFPRLVEFSDWNKDLENFKPAVYVAVRKDLDKLVQKLK